MEKAKDFYSKTVADAIRQACAEFATSQEKLDIEVVETGSAGIFGLCRKRAHIRVTRKQKSEKAEAPKKQRGKRTAPKVTDRPVEKEIGTSGGEDEVREAVPEKRHAEQGREKARGRKREQKKPATPSEEMEPAPIEPPSEEVLASVRSDLEQVLQLMAFPSQINVTYGEGTIRCQIDGEYNETIVGPDGRVLDALQYLMRKMASRELPDKMMIDLNAGDFRERRIEELKRTAVELAEKVKTDGKTQAIPALNPSERRVVHVALQDDKAIRSRSVGDGLFKKVLIYKPGSRSRKTGTKRRGRQSGGSAEK